MEVDENSQNVSKKASSHSFKTAMIAFKVDLINLIGRLPHFI